MSRFLKRVASLFAMSLVVTVTSVSAQTAAKRTGQFFQALSPDAMVMAKSANAKGAQTQAVAVQLNAAELFSLAYLDEIQLTLPTGATHTVVFELAQDHGGGVASWVGHIKGLGSENRVIVTRGPGGAYGLIEAPEGTYRIVPGGVHDWLVDMTQEQLYLPIRRSTNDMRIPPASAKSVSIDLSQAAFEVPVPGKNSVSLGKATPTPNAVIDVMFVVTQGMATNLGSNLATRLNFLITRANTTYVDSEVAITLRLVNTTTVNYTDANDDGTALDAITPGQPTFDAAAFGNIETIRNSVGADMVALMRNGDQFGGSGVAWLGSSTPAAGQMYSVTTGCLASCESVFIHELGHNMGNAHDRKTVAWQSGGTASFSEGAFSHSYGYVFCKSGALSCNPELPPSGGGCPADTGPECSTADPSNFRDIMAYFGGTANDTYRFSNPNINCKSEAPGNDNTLRPCGVSESLPASADNALSMNKNRVALSAIKATVVSGVKLTVSKAGTGSGTVTSNPAGINCGATCSGDFGSGATVTLSATETTGSVFAGWSGDCTGTSACTVTMSAARSVTATFNLSAAFDANVRSVVTSYYQTILGRTPDQAGLDFWAGEATRVVGLGADVREVFFAMSIAFFSSSEYVNRATSDTQYITDMYRTFFSREPDPAGLAYWQGELTAVKSRSALLNSFLFSAEFSNTMTALFGAGGVRPEVTMTIDLYRGSFGRLPDSGGFTYWLGEIRKAQCQGGAAVSAAVNTLSGLFFNSAEYTARARGNGDFVGDVYNAYMRRGPGGDSAGFNFWVGQVPVLGRDGLRAQFVPSTEFQNRVAAVVAAGCLN